MYKSNCPLTLQVGNDVRIVITTNVTKTKKCEIRGVSFFHTDKKISIPHAVLLTYNLEGRNVTYNGVYRTAQQKGTSKVGPIGSPIFQWKEVGHSNPSIFETIGDARADPSLSDEDISCVVETVIRVPIPTPE